MLIVNTFTQTFEVNFILIVLKKLSYFYMN